jgi:hypothetical protein
MGKMKQQNSFFSSTVAVVAAAMIPTTTAHSFPSLTLATTADLATVQPGDVIIIRLAMTDLDESADGAAGFQAFLEFNSDHLSFLNGSYTATPFGLPVIDPIAASGPSSGGDGQIDLAAGINVLTKPPDPLGQPTTTDATLAILNFEVLEPACPYGSAPLSWVSFDAQLDGPPTRLTTINGEEILPLTLIDLESLPLKLPGDANHDLLVDVDDLFAVILAWGDCLPPRVPPVNAPAPPCAGPEDFDCDGTVNIDDLFTVIEHWT